MSTRSLAKREVPGWLALVLVLVVVGVIGWIFYARLSPPGGPDISQLDPRNSENVALFRRLDDYYRQHPDKRPRGWPPPQFTPENIARAQEQSRKEFAEAEQKRAKVIQEYLKQQQDGP
jgi:hypothetical protein